MWHLNTSIGATPPVPAKEHHHHTLTRHGELGMTKQDEQPPAVPSRICCPSPWTRHSSSPTDHQRPTAVLHSAQHLTSAPHQWHHAITTLYVQPSRHPGAQTTMQLRYGCHICTHDDARHNRNLFLMIHYYTAEVENVP